MNFFKISLSLDPLDTIQSALMVVCLPSCFCRPFNIMYCSRVQVADITWFCKAV